MAERSERARMLTALGAALVVAMLAPAASAQIGAGLSRGLGGALGQELRGPSRLIDQARPVLDPQVLLNQRLDRLNALLRAHPRQLELDDHGSPVVRGEVLAVAPAPTALDAAKRAGFEVKLSLGADDGIGLVVLKAPTNVSAREAVKRLRKLDPAGAYDFNHLYELSGESNAEVAIPTSPATTNDRAASVRLGLVDTGVDTKNLALAHARIDQRASTGGIVKPAPHGTAVASLLVGDQAPFRGAAPGGELFVADVYSDAVTGGATDALIEGLNWLAARKVEVINVSLVGPSNLALAVAIKALQTRGITVVAAVGNDGPAAPLAYPASYPGVVAVTGVDAEGRVLLEAGRANHLDFAAPGADMAAAAMGGGFVAVRGTSFAAPLVAGRLAIFLAEKDPKPQAAVDRLAATGRHQRAYGRALVATDLRTPPAKVGARRDGLP